jgi:23S rRNA (cytidine2498-2'-O)-methyltransferase
MDEHEYLIFSDMRFRAKAKKEILSLITNHSATEKNAAFSDRFFIIQTDADRNELLEKIQGTGTIFVNNVIPIIAKISNDKEYEKTIAELKSLLDKKKSLKIEVLRINSKADQNAKSIEVRLGKMLESEGFKVDLMIPDVYVYVVLHLDQTIIGELERKFAATGVVDAFRASNKTSTDKISRSEFKLAEAVDLFNIDMEIVDQAIDIGAAPGGWTKYLSKIGIKTIAIDKAPLDYNILSKNGKVAIISDNEESSAIKNANVFRMEEIDKSKEGFDIVNIVTKANQVGEKELKIFGKFDMLLIDANISPKESAEIAINFSNLLSKGAYLIMTIKLVDKSIDKHINETKASLSKAYGEIKIKKLPHNRMELTCYAIKM